MKRLMNSPLQRNLTISYTRENVAWGTIVTFILGMILFTISSFLSYQNGVSWVVAGINTIAIYCIYIVLHDASHNAVFKSKKRNMLLGNICILFFHPAFAFRTFQLIHMRHHKHTNDPNEDPDIWAHSRYSILMPLKWLTTDLGYIMFLIKNRPKMPLKRVLIQVLHLLLFITIIFLCIVNNQIQAFIYFWFIPFRISLFFLTLFLDYLPHAPYKYKQSEAPSLATRVFDKRGPLGKVIFFLMLGQNYHLSHHMFPTLPFYKSQNIWLQIQSRVYVDPIDE